MTGHSLELNDHEERVAEWRSLFPVTERGAYLFNGGFAVGSTPVADAVQRALEIWRDRGVGLYIDGMKEFERLIDLLAGLSNTDARDWAIVDSTTSALNLAADLLDLQESEEVIITDLEFMTGTYTFVGRQPPVRTTIVESEGGGVPLERIAEAITDRTRAISVAHVTVGSGFRHDLDALADLAQERGLDLVVDVAQSMGVIPVDLSHPGITMAAGTASKWLLGPAGIGILYVRRDLQLRPPPHPGWMGAANSGTWELWSPEFLESAGRFHSGIPNLLGVYAAAAGADLVASIGVDTISERVHALCDYLLRGLDEIGVDIWTPRPWDQRAGLVFFRGVDDEALEAEAIERGMTLGRFLGGIRVDPFFFNTYQELDIVLELAERHLARE